MVEYDATPNRPAIEDACRQARGDCDVCYLAEEGCPDYTPGTACEDDDDA